MPTYKSWHYLRTSALLEITSIFFLGNVYGNITQETVNEMVLKAVQSGINFIDTSPWYGQGVSEERLGIALKNVPRDKYYIATKVSYFKLFDSGSLAGAIVVNALIQYSSLPNNRAPNLILFFGKSPPYTRLFGCFYLNQPNKRV